MTQKEWNAIVLLLFEMCPMDPEQSRRILRLVLEELGIPPADTEKGAQRT